MLKQIIWLAILFISVYLCPAHGNQAVAQEETFQNEELSLFLNELKISVKEHDWEKVLTFFDEQNYEAQRSIGISMPQYIEEGLGLGMENNHLAPREDDVTEFSKLNNIKEIIFNSVVSDGESFTITGQVELYDGSFRECALTVGMNTSGNYKITPAVG